MLVHGEHLPRGGLDEIALATCLGEALLGLPEPDEILRDRNALAAVAIERALAALGLGGRDVTLPVEVAHGQAAFFAGFLGASGALKSRSKTFMLRTASSASSARRRAS